VRLARVRGPGCGRCLELDAAAAGPACGARGPSGLELGEVRAARGRVNVLSLITAVAGPGAGVSCPDRLVRLDFRVLDEAGTVTRAECDEQGRMAFSVRWDGGGETHLVGAHPAGARGCASPIGPGTWQLARRTRGWRISVPRWPATGAHGQGMSASPTAWHAEQPEDSGWPQTMGRLPA
jgi:hypothetical protein